MYAIKCSNCILKISLCHCMYLFLSFIFKLICEWFTNSFLCTFSTSVIMWSNKCLLYKMLVLWRESTSRFLRLHHKSLRCNFIHSFIHSFVVYEMKPRAIVLNHVLSLMYLFIYLFLKNLSRCITKLINYSCWAWNCHPPVSALQDAEIIGVCHHTQICGFYCLGGQ